jgi:hypothetical protein
MNQTETNTYATTTPPHFWRSNLTWRTTNTGMNPNVISKDAPYKGKREYLDQYIDKKIYCTDAARQKRKSLIETVIGCLGDIYSEGRGYVFTDAQLDEVKKIFPRVWVSWNDNFCCYSCYR